MLIAQRVRALMLPTSVAELPHQNWNDSGIIQHFPDSGMEWGQHLVQWNENGIRRLLHGIECE